MAVADKPKRRLDVGLGVNCTAKDREEFDRAAEREGFTNRTAWILYHLRRIARETQSEDQRHET